MTIDLPLSAMLCLRHACGPPDVQIVPAVKDVKSAHTARNINGGLNAWKTLLTIQNHKSLTHQKSASPLAMDTVLTPIGDAASTPIAVTHKPSVTPFLAPATCPARQWTNLRT